ncbi:hypothetical protein [Novacetimonas pomaceti]|uniref:hypothetical protein n=1 Tax=Novacetimonas pomaceti TaxID=2021998 RepID=UPI001C2D64B7|nr:hypothetical protein [Novacetimonas pomaceti]
MPDFPPLLRRGIEHGREYRAFSRLLLTGYWGHKAGDGDDFRAGYDSARYQNISSGGHGFL